MLFPDNTGSAVTVTNNYGLLINDQTANTGTVTYTNRWGIYQEGASDLNYLNANLLLGSTTNSGEKLQVTGTSKFSNSLTANGGIIVQGYTAASSGLNLEIGVISGYVQQNAYNRTTSAFVPFRLDGSSIILNSGSGGNVGIGTITPTEKLNVVTSGSKSTISIGSTAASTYSQLLMYGGAGKFNWSIGAQYNVNNALEITPSTVIEGTTFTTPVVSILSGGSVGINTTSTNVPLEVNGQIRSTRIGSASQYLQIEGGDAVGPYITAAGASKVLTIRNNSTTSSIIQFDQAVASRLIFAQAGTAKAELSAAGNFLINTTTDAGYKLHVSGVAYSSSRFLSSGGSFDPTTGNNWVNASFSTLANASPYGGGIALIDGTAGFCQWLDGAGANFRLGYATTGTNPTSQFLLTSAGNVAVAGSIQTGTPNGGTTGAWKLGSYKAAAVTLNTGNYIEVDIGGTLYKLAVVT